MFALVFFGCSYDPEIPPALDSKEVRDEPAPAVSVSELNLDERGRALRGFDPVSYFTTGQPVPGSVEFRTTWNGAEYLFASQAHRDTFLEHPERYLPAHGGFCTFGIVLKKKFDGDPQVWLLRNDQLHVFLNKDVRGKFLSDEEGNFDRVEENWSKIRNKTVDELEEANVPGIGKDS